VSVPSSSGDDARSSRVDSESEFWGSASRADAFRRPRPRGRAEWGDGPVGRLGDRWGERVRDWRPDGRVGVVVLVVAALVAGLVFYKVGAGSGDASASAAPASAVRRDAPARAAVSAPPSGSAGDSAAVPATGSGSGSASGVVVHVAGAVVTPGVVRLAAGARVIDAVEAAGGGLPNADLDRLNLAAKLVDGQRVLVQHVGDPPAAADPSVPVDAATPAPAGPLNLNTATQPQLEDLPGIGPSLAQAILAERDRKGGFRSINELREVRGIGEKRFADLKPLVTV
jgi:competence protein ComEA